MFITQQQLNEVLDNHFTNNGQFDQRHFDHSIQLILDNHHDLYDMMRSSAMEPINVAFEAFRRFAREACEGEYGYVIGLTQSMLISWVWSKDTTNSYSIQMFDNTNNYIETERAAAQKEKEETTMKNTINTTAANIVSEDIICSECGQIIIKAGEELNSELYEVIDGEYVCKDCVDEHFVECSYCGEYVRKDDACEVEGDWVCEDCRDEHYYYCEECDEWHDEDHIQYIESTERWVCDDCLENYYTRCEHCGEYVRNNDIITVIVNRRGWTEEWCQSCCEDETWVCDDCGETYSDDVEFVEDGWDRYCPNCRGDEVQDTGDINTWRSPRCREGYSFKPAPCFCAIDSEREQHGSDWKKNIVFYGFELEIDRKEKCHEENAWSAKIVDKLPTTYCKKDCSLDKGGDYSGIEIVSHPATLAWYEEHKDQFESCFDMLKEGDWLSHDAGTCGLHVHISLHAMEAANPYAVNNMLYLVDRFWDKLVKFSRRTNAQLDHWAKRYSTAHGTYDDIKYMAKRERDRYMAVNLCNDHTVEIRMFRGTLNLESFFATLQLVDTMVKRCIDLGHDLRSLQTMTWEEFVQSDHTELNSYLKRRGLIEGCKEQPEPAEGKEPEKPESWHGIAVGDEVTVNMMLNADHWAPAEYCRGIVRGFDGCNFAVEFPNWRTLNDEFGIWFHDCNGLCDGTSGRWVAISEFMRADAVQDILDTLYLIF